MPYFVKSPALSQVNTVTAIDVRRFPVVSVSFHACKTHTLRMAEASTQALQ